jgi:hypothetical protein
MRGDGAATRGRCSMRCGPLYGLGASALDVSKGYGASLPAGGRSYGDGASSDCDTLAPDEGASTPHTSMARREPSRARSRFGLEPRAAQMRSHGSESRDPGSACRRKLCLRLGKRCCPSMVKPRKSTQSSRAFASSKLRSMGRLAELHACLGNCRMTVSSRRCRRDTGRRSAPLGCRRGQALPCARLRLRGTFEGLTRRSSAARAGGRAHCHPSPPLQ